MRVNDPTYYNIIVITHTILTLITQIHHNIRNDSPNIFHHIYEFNKCVARQLNCVFAGVTYSRCGRGREYNSLDRSREYIGNLT